MGWYFYPAILNPTRIGRVVIRTPACIYGEAVAPIVILPLFGFRNTVFFFFSVCYAFLDHQRASSTESKEKLDPTPTPSSPCASSLSEMICEVA
jgi:hypothetical protein